MAGGASTAFAQTGDPVATTLQAVQAIDVAAQTLAQAQDAEDQIAALTASVKAYEQGLSALREAQRRARLARQSLETDFEGRSGEVSRLLGAMQAAGAPTTPTRLLHPVGPLASARAANLLAEIIPALQAEAFNLRIEVDGLLALEAAIEDADTSLREGAEAARLARLSLVEALRNRDETKDTRYEVFNDLNAAGQTIEDLMLSLIEGNAGTVVTDQTGFLEEIGTYAWPVSGLLLTGYRDTEIRPGWTIATEPDALVTTPARATLRFAGEISGYDTVLILEVAAGHLLILSGVHEPLVHVGQVLPPGAALGLMGPTRTRQVGSQDDLGQLLTETLYVETRANGEMVDPATWFALDKER